MSSLSRQRFPRTASLIGWLFVGGVSAASGQDSVSPEITAVAAVSRESIPTGEVSAVGPPDPSSPGPEGQQRRERIEAARDAEGALELGWSFFERGQWESARQWFQEAHEYDPNSKRAAEGRIMTEYRAGRIGEAYRLAVVHEDLVPEGRGIVARAAAVSGQQWVDAGELEKAESMLSGIPESEEAVVELRRSIAENRVETAVAREDFAEARTIAQAQGIDLERVDREESVDLLQAATEAADRGEHRESLALVGRAEAMAPLDRSGRRVKAWALYHNRDFDESSGLFEDLYREGKDRDSAEGLVNSLQQSGDTDRLEALTEEMGGPLAAVSEPVLMAASRAEEDRKRQEAEAQRQAALAMAEEERNREAMIAAAELPDPNAGEKGPVPMPTEDRGSDRGPSVEPMNLLMAALDSSRRPDLSENPSRRPIPEGPRISIGGGVKVREGDEGGVDRLRVNRLPSVETTLVLGEDGNQSITIGVHVMKLESGKPRGNRLVGSADSTLDPGPFVTETDTLVQPMFAYRREMGRRVFFAEIGATPLGAELSASPVGAIGFVSEGESGAIGIEGFAESVQDSLLSYTGMTDPYTGKEWGRVVESGVRVDGARKLGRQWSGHGQFAFKHLDGSGVDDNNAVIADLGLSYELDVPGFDYLVIGPTFHFEHYEKNRSEFTLGHGGYFSPDELYQGMLGISFLTESGRRWLAEGFLGVGGQSHEMEVAPVLPNSPDGRFYDGSSDSSAIFTARLQTLFELSPQWRLGAEAGYAKSAAYEDFAVGLYLSILFDPEWGLDRGDFVRW